MRNIQHGAAAHSPSATLIRRSISFLRFSLIDSDTIESDTPNPTPSRYLGITHARTYTRAHSLTHTQTHEGQLQAHAACMHTLTHINSHHQVCTHSRPPMPNTAQRATHPYKHGNNRYLQSSPTWETLEAATADQKIYIYTFSKKLTRKLQSNHISINCCESRNGVGPIYVVLHKVQLIDWTWVWSEIDGFRGQTSRFFFCFIFLHGDLCQCVPVCVSVLKQ